MSHTYVNKYVRKFSETECIHNIERTNTRVLNEPTKIGVLGHFAINHNYSLCQVSKLSGISIGSMHKILKINKFRPYKM